MGAIKRFGQRVKTYFPLKASLSGQRRQQRKAIVGNLKEIGKAEREIRGLNKETRQMQSELLKKIKKTERELATLQSRREKLERKINLNKNQPPEGNREAVDLVTKISQLKNTLQQSKETQGSIESLAKTGRQPIEQRLASLKTFQAPPLQAPTPPSKLKRYLLQPLPKTIKEMRENRRRKKAAAATGAP